MGELVVNDDEVAVDVHLGGAPMLLPRWLRTMKLVNLGCWSMVEFWTWDLMELKSIGFVASIAQWIICLIFGCPNSLSTTVSPAFQASTPLALTFRFVISRFNHYGRASTMTCSNLSCGWDGKRVEAVGIEEKKLFCHSFTMWWQTQIPYIRNYLSFGTNTIWHCSVVHVRLKSLGCSSTKILTFFFFVFKH